MAREHRLSLHRIEAAVAVIDPVFLQTPQFVSEPLSDATGARLAVKVETLNPIRSFKGRGACVLAAGLPPGTHIVTASAGNLGQGLAYACRIHGNKLTVFAACNASPIKVQRMRYLGAEVILAGEDFDAAKAIARQHAADTGLRMIEDGLEPALSEGAGTIAIELLKSPERLDVVLVALGNGAMLGGMARWFSAHAPIVEVIGVAAAGAPCMANSWRGGAPQLGAPVDTIADGLATRVPIPEAVADLSGTIADVVLVKDPAMIEAMRLAHQHLGLVLEPSGAAGIAAILSDPARFRGRTVATVLCGGNLTQEQMTKWLK